MDFRVAGPFPAYGAQPGETVTLDSDDPLVQIHLESGVLAPADESTPATPEEN